MHHNGAFFYSLKFIQLTKNEFFLFLVSGVIICVGENMRLIQREKYLNKLINVKNTPDIKIISGSRRSGKSKLLQAYMKWLFENDKNANIIWINLQEAENEIYLDYHKLHEHIINSYIENKNNYLLVDEVQLCPNFELAINSIHAKEIFDIYLTGSNAFLLSSDLATLFTGRTFTIEVFPFSFEEFIKYYGYSNVNEAFDLYVKEGGFAGSYLYSDINDKYSYIKKDVFNTIVVRDIASKYKIKNSILFENLTNFLIDNISNLTSVRNIENYLSSNLKSVSHNTISNYINYLSRAFIFYEAKRYDIKGKKYLSTERKYYLCDHGMKYAILGTRNEDLGRVYENIVFIELLRRGYDVYIGKFYEKEIDFIAVKQSEKIYIQVSLNIADKKTLNREISSLLKINDNFPKIIISRTNHDEYTIDGIKVVDIADWLLR